MIYKNLEEEANTRDPCSKFSAFVTQIFLNVDNDAIQVACNLSGAAAIYEFWFLLALTDVYAIHLTVSRHSLGTK